MRRWVGGVVCWLVWTAGGAGQGANLSPQEVTIPGQRYAAYREIPAEGADLTLVIRADPVRVARIVDSTIVPENDEVLWGRTSRTDAAHVYQIGAVRSSREWVFIHGRYQPLGAGGVGGPTALPEFDVDVPAADLDWAGVAEVDEETLGGFVGVGQRQALVIHPVHDRRAAAQQVLTWPADRVSLWTAPSDGSRWPGGSRTLSAQDSTAVWLQGETPSAAVRDSALILTYACSEGPTAEDKINLTVLKVESVSVDATDDIGPTKINYRVLPAGASIPSVTFTAPGMTETRANVSGNLCFTYNQTDLVPGNNTIRISYLSCQTDITANKQAAPKGPAQEIVIATYPENDTPPVLVNIPIVHNITSERYWRITYSGAPVVPGSRTLHVGSTDVEIQVPDTRDISWVLEKHRYHDNDGNHRERVMSLVTGITLPQTTGYRKYYEVFEDAFFKPGNGLTGIAQLDAMAFDDNGNIVQPVNIANEEVDQSME